MTCATCREDWCWLCREHCEPNHFNNNIMHPACYGRMFPPENQAKMVAIRGAVVAGMVLASPFIFVGGGAYLLYQSVKYVFTGESDVINA